MSLVPENVEKLRSLLPAWEQRKQVHGDKITAIDRMQEHDQIRMTTRTGLRIQESWAWYERHTPQIGGYYVLYKDGYASYSPAEPFEEACGIKQAVGEFSWMDSAWLARFAADNNNRYNTIRWGSPDISPTFFRDVMRSSTTMSDMKRVFVFGLKVAQYFDKLMLNPEPQDPVALERTLCDFFLPATAEDRARGWLGTLMGCRVFIDTELVLSPTMLILVKFRGNTCVGHCASGVRLT